MPGDLRSISAFAVYAAKRKNTEKLLNSKKMKNKHVVQETSIVNKNLKTQKVVKQNKTNKKEARSKHKCSNNLKKTLHIVANKIDLENMKFDSLLKKVKPARKQSNKIQKLNKVNHAQNNIRDKSKLKKCKKNKTETKIKKKVKDKDKKLIKTTTKQYHISKSNSNNDTECIDIYENPILSSQELFEWLIHPIAVEDFFTQNWEKTPVHIKRNSSNYYKFLMSTPLLDKILRENHILFTKNIDVTSYFNGVRETHNPPGRALPSVVWDYYLNDCSVRMLNPQTFIPKLHALNANLQEFFGCFVGSNSYLTPPNSQGFAPHYDDIEAFILQIEGKKRWRLYKPRNENEYLPSQSSKNFDQSEIGEPILDTIVNAGDLLYFPRGTIHQGETIDHTHSLHITLSVYQKNSWCDLFKQLLPEALKRASETDSRFRKGLPLDYLRYTGVAYSTTDSKAKRNLEAKIKTLFTQLIDHIDIDRAADLMAKNHIHDFLPPVLMENEQKCSVVKDGEIMTANGVVKNSVEIEPETRIRLLRAHCIRLVEEDDTYRIYYSTENSKEYHEYESQFLKLSEEFVPALREIIIRYPEFICVEDLPINGEDNKIQIVKDLWEKGLVITDFPLIHNCV